MSQPSNRRRSRRNGQTAAPMNLPLQPTFTEPQDPQQTELSAQAAASILPDGVAVGDQVARAAQEAALAAGDVVPDPFAPTPLDPAALTGTPAERLAQVEAALHAADARAGRSVRAAKVRWTIEKGTPLAILNFLHPAERLPGQGTRPAPRARRRRRQGGRGHHRSPGRR
ncbi:hypothetical protein ACFFSH_39185 [Streptomyces filamentosus]|uniref:Uncharacterized protein n=1 Tax=Streptomyces filamentosus TaxID=67294 RepID=A0A919ESX1_STRFL|nr:hypothetical protein [Streptomyces filamentosus]GHG23723.1 hypothetical protein GCM10017667_68980 [Streptomyces filamentosus]